MRIAGIEKCSFVDYPGCLAAVVFTPGCNWDCFYCHNRLLLNVDASHTWLDLEVTFAWLDERRGLLDAVVVSGGEPTLQHGLDAFIRAVRDKGFLVKLDTNGTRPEALEALLDEGLLDYVAMDIKAPMVMYEDICGARVDHAAINASIDLLLAGRVDYEFRTTVIPQFTEADILAIARRIPGARRYVLQQFRVPEPAPSDPRLTVRAHPATWPFGILGELETIVQCCETRGFKRLTEVAEYSAA